MDTKISDTKLTKIIATIGPASDSKKTIVKLINEGVNIFRFNTKHATTAWHEEKIKKVQAIADEMKVSIGILIDLQGPEIRIQTKDEKPVSIQKNEEVVIKSSFQDKDTKLVIGHKIVLDVLNIDDYILIDDGHIRLQVVAKRKDFITVKPLEETIIHNKKGVNIPGKNIDLPSLIESDLKQLDMAAMNKVDFIALSFARHTDDIDILKAEMKKRSLETHIVVKIENQQALDNIDALIECSDAVMVARGDLGVEAPIEKLSYWQKIIIDKCKATYKPVITATEMLDSMMTKNLPTRAEATDVSNAVFEGTDALMLSGETATGKYAVESVKIMARIAKFTESVRKFKPHKKGAKDKTQIVGIAAMDMLASSWVNVDMIVVFTQTGYTARVVSASRPKIPIIAVTNNQQTVENLSMSYGVFGHKFIFPNGKLVSPDYILNKLEKRGVVKKGDTALVIHGARWKEPGLTNSISLITH